MNFIFKTSIPGSKDMKQYVSLLLNKRRTPSEMLKYFLKKKIYIYIWPIYSIFFHLDQWKRAFGVDLNEQGFRKRLISLERGYQVYIF